MVFLSHEMLDYYVNQLLIKLNMNMTAFAAKYPDGNSTICILHFSIEYYLLKAFDRGYWFKHQKKETKQNATTTTPTTLESNSADALLVPFYKPKNCPFNMLHQ